MNKKERIALYKDLNRIDTANIKFINSARTKGRLNFLSKDIDREYNDILSDTITSKTYDNAEMDKDISVVLKSKSMLQSLINSRLSLIEAIEQLEAEEK